MPAQPPSARRGKERGDSYLFTPTGGTEQDFERLRNLAEHGFNIPTGKYLDSLGLSGIGITLDLGCGIGTEFGKLAEHTDKIIAVDFEAKMLSKAQVTVEALHLQGRVDLRQEDATHLESIPDNSVDMVYMRLFLQHFTKKDRKKVMKEIKRVLKPGGIVVAEDLEMSFKGTWHFEPPSKALTTLHRAMMKVYSKLKTERDMGPKLPKLFRKVGLVEVSRDRYMVVGDGKHPFKQSHIDTLLGIKSRILEFGIMKEKDFDEALERMKQDLFDEQTTAYSPTMYQVAFQKPA